MSEERGERLRQSFQSADRDRQWPNQRPRDAATLIILDRSGPSPQVLMGRRHHGHKFMPGKFVFPGGRLERSDRFMPAASELPAATAGRLAERVTRRSDGRARALALTALREAYEETGLVIGRPSDVSGRRRIPTGWTAFIEAGILPDLGQVSFVGRAITPPRRPKRFDTRFFAVDRTQVCREDSGFVGPDKELVELVWIELAAAQALELPRITSIMLQELEQRIEEGFPQDAPVPFYREERGRFLRDLL